MGKEAEQAKETAQAAQKELQDAQKFDKAQKKFDKATNTQNKAFEIDLKTEKFKKSDKQQLNAIKNAQKAK